MLFYKSVMFNLLNYKFMKSVKKVLGIIDSCAIVLFAFLWLSLAMVWALPIIGENQESPETPMLESAEVIECVMSPEFESTPVAAKAVICSYIPLLWVVSPTSFHLQPIGNSDYYEPAGWTWILMVLTFLIGIGMYVALFWWGRIGEKIQKRWAIAAKTLFDVCITIHLLFGVVMIYISLF